MIKCVICDSEGEFIFTGNSYCREHFEKEKLNFDRHQQSAKDMIIKMQKQFGMEPQEVYDMQ